jgi:hypothetical protein
MERGLHGLEPAVVASFPTKKFSEFSHSDQDLQYVLSRFKLYLLVTIINRLNFLSLLLITQRLA